jgi:transcription elongation factor SPT5
VEQQALLPTHTDPKLWIVECRPGEEREAVVKLLQKAVNLARTPMPLLVKSAFVQDHLKVRRLTYFICKTSRLGRKQAHC